MQAVVKSVLNNVIGRFCEFEGDINLSMWSGKAVLRHVRLKPGCLADMGLPLDISAGFVDRIELVADWRGGFNKPVEVCYQSTANNATEPLLDDIESTII